jgi:hypothetical protein
VSFYGLSLSSQIPRGNQRNHREQALSTSIRIENERVP